MNKNERMICVLLLALVVLAPTSAFVGYQYAVWGGAISSPGTTYGPGDVDTAAYVIFRDGSTYYAKNGVTRVVDFSSTNASYVVTECLEAMIASSVYFGTLHFTKGVFEFTTQVMMVRTLGSGVRLGLIIEGEGRYTTALAAIGAHPVFNFTSVSRNDRFESFTVRSLEIRSDQLTRTQGAHGLVFVNATFVNIYDCYFETCADSGVWLEGLETNFIHDNGFYECWGNGISIQAASDCHIYGNSITLSGRNGISVNSAAWGTNIYGNNIIYSGYNGIQLYSTSKASITGNAAIYGNGYDGIELGGFWSGGKRYGCDNNTITGNTVCSNSESLDNTFNGIHIADSCRNTVWGNRVYDEGAAPKQCWGIREDASSDYNEIMGNNLRDAGTTGWIFINGTNTKAGLCWNGTATWLAAP